MIEGCPEGALKAPSAMGVGSVEAPDLMMQRPVVAVVPIDARDRRERVERGTKTGGATGGRSASLARGGALPHTSCSSSSLRPRSVAVCPLVPHSGEQL
jgi:hypothetical protein